MITLRPPFRAEDMASLYKKVLKGKSTLLLKQIKGFIQKFKVITPQIWQIWSDLFFKFQLI